MFKIHDSEPSMTRKSGSAHYVQHCRSVFVFRVQLDVFVYLPFACVCGIGILFTHFIVETKGLSEIQVLERLKTKSDSQTTTRAC